MLLSTHPLFIGSNSAAGVLLRKANQIQLLGACHRDLRRARQAKIRVAWGQLLSGGLEPNRWFGG